MKLGGKKMEISKERLNEIGYALLIAVLSEQEVKLNPSQLKRKIGNLPNQLAHLPKQFGSFSKEELREACSTVMHDLVDYAFGFSFEDKNEKK
jgi:hypothetical protein